MTREEALLLLSEDPLAFRTAVYENVWSVRVDPQDCACTDCILGEESVPMSEHLIPNFLELGTAMTIVMKLHEVFWTGMGSDTHDQTWEVNFYNKTQFHTEFHKDLPTAICLAALQVMIT